MHRRKLLDVIGGVRIDPYRNHLTPCVGNESMLNNSSNASPIFAGENK